MVQLAIQFWGITLHFMLCAVSGASPAGIDSTPQALAPSNSTTVPSPVSVFLLCITITNRIFNESLKNQSSEDYKELRYELKQLLDDVYKSEPYNYSGISAMTFSEGSVVANTTVVFNTTGIKPSTVENLFLSYVKKNPPPYLDLNVTEVQKILLPDDEHQGNARTGATMWPTTPRLKTATETTVHPASKSASGITNTEPAVSETPSPSESPFTETTGRIHNTTRFHSENNTNISDLTSSIGNTTVVTNSPTDDATITSNGTTKSPSTESTQSLLTRDTKDSTATSYPLSSSTINPVTNFNTTLSISIGSTRATSTSSSTTDESLSETSSPQIYSSSPTVHPPISTAMTTVITSSHNTTITSTDITSITSLSTQSLPLSSTTDPPITGTPNASESSTATIPTTFTPNSTSPHPDPGTTAQFTSSLPDTTATSLPVTTANSLPATTASISSPPLDKTTREHTTRTTSEPLASPTSASTPGAAAVGQAVPGWAVALLVLASLILVFLILLIIALLVYWCCKRRQYDFMNMAEDPGVYDQVNHGADIPMYTTHSHFGSSNGKPYEDTEKPMKSRTMYTVNKR